MTNSENETDFELLGDMPKGLEDRARRTLKNRKASEGRSGVDDKLPFDDLIGQAVELHSLRRSYAWLQLEAATWKRKYFELLVGESEDAPLNSRQRKKAIKGLEDAQHEEEEALALPDLDLPEDDSTIQR